MSRKEQHLLASAYSTRSSVFEWGMGSSTLLAMHMNISRLTAVDSSREWVRKVKELANSPNFTFVHADIGPVREFGHPTDRKSKHLWPNYSKTVDLQPAPYGIYLVDGRFRVACACRALLHARCDSLIAVHDFQRGDYQHLLTLMEKVIQVETLAIFRKKRNISHEQIDSMWRSFQFIQH